MVLYRSVPKRRRVVAAVATPTVTVPTPVVEEPTERDFNALTKDELVAAAQARGVASHGTKAEIAARLSDG